MMVFIPLSACDHPETCVILCVNGKSLILNFVVSELIPVLVNSTSKFRIKIVPDCMDRQ